MTHTNDRPDWERIPKQNIFYYKCPKHKKGYVLSIVFNFENPEETYVRAFILPAAIPPSCRLCFNTIHDTRCDDGDFPSLSSFLFVPRMTPHTNSQTHTTHTKQTQLPSRYEFAYCYPYTYTRLQNYLERLDARGMPYFTRERLCQSVQKRRPVIITLSPPSFTSDFLNIEGH